MAPSKQLLVALLLGALAGQAHGVEGDVIAASDFRSGTQDWSLKGLGSAMGWSSEGLQSEGDVIAAIDSPADTDKAGEISPQKPRQWPVFNLAMWQNDDDDDDPDKETCVICKVSMPLHTALGHVACPSLPSILPLATCPS